MALVLDPDSGEVRVFTKRMSESDLRKIEIVLESLIEENDAEDQ